MTTSLALAGVTATGRATVATRPRRGLLAVALLAAPAVALLVDAGGPAPFAAVAGPVHGAVSVVLPFLAIVVVRDPGVDAVGRPLPVVVGLVALAVGVGLVADVVCLLAAGGRGSVAIAVGGVAVQVLSQLVGVVCGLLPVRTAVALVADVVVPLGAWAATGAAGWHGLRSWATPYGVVVDLLAPGPLAGVPPVVARLVVVLVVWVVVPGVAALVVARRRRTAGASSGAR